jgi:hypothetical protein
MSIYPKRGHGFRPRGDGGLTTHHIIDLSVGGFTYNLALGWLQSKEIKQFKSFSTI